MKHNFEKLVYNGAWFGKLEVVFNGVKCNIDLQIDGYDETCVPEDGKEALNSFLQCMQSLEFYIGDETLKYYKKLRKQLGYDVDKNEDYPFVDSAESILGMINLVGIIIPDQDDYEDRAIALAFDCSWDKENGLGICFVGNKIIDIGYQDVAL